MNTEKLKTTTLVISLTINLALAAFLIATFSPITKSISETDTHTETKPEVKSPYDESEELSGAIYAMVKLNKAYLNQGPKPSESVIQVAYDLETIINKKTLELLASTKKFFGQCGNFTDHGYFEFYVTVGEEYLLQRGSWDSGPNSVLEFAIKTGLKKHYSCTLYN